ncbi:MAG: 2OG-Fe(II) oxygenase [Bacteroidota bacterium]
MQEVQSGSNMILDVEKWQKSVAEDAHVYQAANPYPHIVLDNFLEAPAAQIAYEAFPKVGDEGWIHYLHVNEKKHGLNKAELLPDYIQSVIRVLNSPQCINWLEKLTGIENLLADEMLEGGGLHQSQRGGFLNVHADFTVHPHKRNWRRRVNLLVYLNPDWQEDYQGHLELWSRDMKRCEQRVLPIMNRCVIFNTDEDSFHGLPDPIQCPEHDTRKSIALYYFTEEKNLPKKRTTNYRARPDDGAKAILIWADKTLVSLYSRVKSTLGLNDDFASKVLGFFNRKKK